MRRGMKTRLLRRALALCLSLLCALGSALADTTNVETTLYDELKKQEQAAEDDLPSCSVPGCAHLSMGADGKLTALCPYGEWLLSADQMGVMLMATAPEEIALIDGANYLYRSSTYRLTGGGDHATLAIPQKKSMVLRLDGAKLQTLYLFSGASAGLALANGASVSALDARDAALSVYGEQHIGSATGALTVTGDGILYVSSLSAVLQPASDGNCRLISPAITPAAVEKWVRVTASTPFTHELTKVLYNGQPIPLCFSDGETEAYAPLDETKQYEATIAGTVCTLRMKPAFQEYLLTADSTPLEIDADGVLKSQGSAAQSANVSKSVSLEVSGARTAGTLRVSAGTTRLKSFGSCSFGALAIESGISVSVKGGGSLRVGSLQNDGSLALDAQTNFSVGTNPPASIGGAKPSVISISDENGAAVTHTKLILNIGASESFSTTTDEDGRVTLWRAEAITNVSAVALSGNDTYAAVVVNGQGTADALPEIDSVNVDHKTGAVTVRAANAGTYGIQYTVSGGEEALPDAYVSAAKREYSTDGKFNLRRLIADLKPGQTVSFRVFAARESGIALSGQTEDAFSFSQMQYFRAPDKPLYAPGTQSAVFNGTEFAFRKGVIPKSVTKPIKYYHNGELLRSPPVDAGSYTAMVEIPASDPDYRAGIYEVSVYIQPLRIYVYPFGGEKKKGEPDPESAFDYFTDELVGGETLVGDLYRFKGETYGNYPYSAGGFSAVNAMGQRVYNYHFVIAPGSPTFFINWNFRHYLPLDPFSRIDPVFDEVHFSDGSMLSVQYRTSEVLKLGGRYLGTLVRDTETWEPRPYTPSLRIRGGVDKALLIVTADAELNKDGGYKTDRDGNRLWNGRTLTLSSYQLNIFKSLKITDIAFSLKGATLLFSLDELTGAGAQELLAQSGMEARGLLYAVELMPVVASGALNAGEAAAQGAQAENEPLMRVRAYADNGEKQAELSPALNSARILFDATGVYRLSREKAQAVSDVTETVNGKPVEAGPAREGREQEAVLGMIGQTDMSDDMLDLAYQALAKEAAEGGFALRRYREDQMEALDSEIVVPYTSSEPKQTPYAALLRTKPFFIAPFAVSALYGLAPR